MKRTINGFITWSHRSYTMQPIINFVQFDPRLSDWCHDIVVREHSIEIEVRDDFDPVPVQVAALQAEKKKIKADFSKRVMEIDREIGKLLAITNEVK